MRLARAITVLAAGAATVWFLERRQLLPGQRRPELPWPPEPGPQAGDPATQAPHPAPDAEDAEPDAEDAEPDAEEPSASVFAPSEQPTREQPAVEQEPEHVDVTSLVDDLIAPGPGVPEGTIFDAEVVEDELAGSMDDELAGSIDDERIAQTVRDVLAISPDVPSEAVTVEVTQGTVFLRGEIDRAGTIRELEERILELDGVSGLRNLLHLPGTPPPT